MESQAYRPFTVRRNSLRFHVYERKSNLQLNKDLQVPGKR